jgi:hypothetical protein
MRTNEEMNTMTKLEEHLEMTKLTKMDEMTAMVGKLKEELNSNSLQMEQLSEDVRSLMYAVQGLTEVIGVIKMSQSSNKD